MRQLDKDKCSSYENQRTIRRRLALSSLLCACRTHSKNRQESPSSNTAPLLTENEPTSDSAPLYYILSEVGSEYMENPDKPTTGTLQKEQHSNHKTAGNCFPRLRRPRFPSFFKGLPVKEDLPALPLERDNTSLEYDDGDSAYEISPQSVFSTIRPSQARKSSFYPSQFRRDQSEQVSLYPSISRVQQAERGGLGTREESTESFLQLVVHELDESGAIPLHRSRQLGVAFPHPAAIQSLEQDECCLGVHTGHPHWIEREKSNVCDSIYSGPIDDGELSAPPSPIVVETLTANTSFSSNRRAPLADDPEDSASPEMWKEDSACRSIYTLANKLSSCGAGKVDDISSYDDVPFDEEAMVADDAPFDEMAIDVEQYTDPHLLTMSPRSSDTVWMPRLFVDDESSFMAPWTESSRSTNT